MPNLTFYRSANVSSKEATSELLAAQPGYEIAELEVEQASKETARHARVTVGSLVYKATLKIAEGLEPEFSEADDAPAEESAPPKEEPIEEPEAEEKPEPKEEGEEKKAPPKPEGEKSDKPAGPEGEGKLKPEEEMVHLLKQILDAVKPAGLGGPEDPMGPPEPKGLGPALPPKKPGLSGPPPGGLGGPAGPGGPALPPPVDKAPAGAAFASVRNAASFTVVREQANELGLRGLKAEAESMFPTHRVAKIRTTGFAAIDGSEVYLPEAKLAVIELISR